LPPVGGLAIAAALDDAGIPWQLVDGAGVPSFTPSSVDALVAFLQKRPEPVLGLSLFHDALPLVVATLSRAAGALAGRRIFLGGPGVVGLAERLLAALPAVEAVVVGAGEQVVAPLVRGAKRGPLPGVVTRQPADAPPVRALLRKGPEREPTLDELPPVPWEWCRGRGYDLVPLSTMRGCPFACTFCEVEALSGRRVEKRSLGPALDELSLAALAIASREVQVLDDTFTLSKKRTLAFAEAVRGRPERYSFRFFSRTDTFDEDMMAALAAAGGAEVSFGLDAGDDELLGRVTRGIRVAEAEACAVRASEHMPVSVHVIWGYPFETYAAFAKAVSLCRRLRQRGRRFPIRAELHLLQPSVATSLFAAHAAELVYGRPDISPLVQNSAGKAANFFRDRWWGAAYHRFETDAFAAKVRLWEAHGREPARGPSFSQEVDAA
jgi:radical SAM superfamily enzyme YgiQ (UPF0313 family)